MQQPNESIEAWSMSRLGFAIDAYVDREINKPTAISNNSAYGIDESGRMYLQGQATQSATPRQPINTTFLILVLAGVFLAMQK